MALVKILVYAIHPRSVAAGRQQIGALDMGNLIIMSHLIIQQHQWLPAHNIQHPHFRLPEHDLASWALNLCP